MFVEPRYELGEFLRLQTVRFFEQFIGRFHASSLPRMVARRLTRQLSTRTFIIDNLSYLEILAGLVPFSPAQARPVPGRRAADPLLEEGFPVYHPARNDPFRENEGARASSYCSFLPSPNRPREPLPMLLERRFRTKSFTSERTVSRDRFGQHCRHV